MIKLKKKYRHFIEDAVLIILIGAFIFGTYKTLNIWYQENKASKEADKLISEVTNMTPKDDSKNIQQDEFTVDFDKLKKINEDVIAWIRIPETKINYPILQGVNNDYYLDKNIEKKYSISGSIFMNYLNDKNFKDNNTIIYGHNTNNGTLFGGLKDIYDGKLGKNVEIQIYTEENMYIYQVYSAYITEPENEEPYNIETKYFSNSDIKFDYNNTGLETLTLSTCYKDSSRRLIIHAIRQKDDENME